MATSATPTSGQPIAAGGNQLASLVELLPQLFGDKKTQTSNAGDTTGLQQLITQLQGTDYTKTLESIFQQAGGQIPGLQAAFSNAVGARSGNNSAVQAALSQLLQQTTLAGQKQVADQTLQNQQIQASAGNAVANATKGTTQTTKVDGQGGKLAGLLGLIQAAKAATGSRDLEELGRKFGLGGARSPGTAVTAGTAMPAAVGPAATGATGAQSITGAAAPQMSMAPGGFNLDAILTGGSVVDFGNNGMGGGGEFDWNGGMSTAPAFNLNDYLGNEPAQMTPNPSYNPGGSFNMDWFNQPDAGFSIDPGYIDPTSWY